MYKIIYLFLIRFSLMRDKFWWNFLWKYFIVPNMSKPVTIRVHNEQISLNCGYTYPIYTRVFNSINNPLVQLAYQTRQILNRPLRMIDVGAAIGDTVLLVEKNIDSVFDSVLCIDGDDEFYDYLEKNMAPRTYVQTYKATLTSESGTLVGDLIRTHSGTASVQGNVNGRLSMSLDDLVAAIDFSNIHLVKIDVDGYDGNVLAGAKNILNQHKPNVIFEWHPIMLNDTGNSIYQSFEVLIECGYEHFIFFNKYGFFSHYMYNVNYESIDFLNKISLLSKLEYDWHYDVIALERDSKIDMYDLAACEYAKNKKSPF